MKQNGRLNRQYVGFRQAAELALETGFVCHHDLVDHYFALRPRDRHQCLAWILTARAAG